ncbi:acyl-CoA thioesterase [Tomitella biformata]|uniref:acyl-CoA thioesterase n=1 Tax=Tomitella biformata TaxID=630403 RepID=UPI0004671A05|nr:thioesterase family protein [Tomitella biformata]
MQAGPKTTVRVHVRLDDMTPAMHVGNASVVRIIEEARMFYLGHPVPGRLPFNNGILEVLQGRANMLIAQQTVEYVGEMFYSTEPLFVTFWIGHLGGSSATLCAEIRVTEDADPIVKTEATMVMVAVDTGKSWPLPDDVRAHLANHMAEPIALRPRPGARV